jgi:hypothetical protein
MVALQICRTDILAQTDVSKQFGALYRATSIRKMIQFLIIKMINNVILLLQLINMVQECLTDVPAKCRTDILAQIVVLQ